MKTIYQLTILTSALFFLHGYGIAQQDLIPSSHPVYRYLFRQEIHNTIEGFNWGMLPLSRHEILSYLDSLRDRNAQGKIHLTSTDQQLLKEYRSNFLMQGPEFDSTTTSFLSNPDFSTLFEDNQQKYLYRYSDSTVSLTADGFGFLTRRMGRGDSIGNRFASLGELGFRLRGTFHNTLGFYLQASNGALLNGSRDFATQFDNHLATNRKFLSSEARYFDYTIGYLRYANNWLSLTAGRDQILWGMGYGDRAVFSDNTVPFDFYKIDITHGSFHYSFLHGSLVGANTSGYTLSSKYIATHRVEFSLGSRVRLGFSEIVLYSNQPMNFAMMNPFIFLTSAELSSELPQKDDNSHNTLIFIDAEVHPFRDLRWFGSMLIDDMSFSYVGKSDIKANTNKFGWHTGISIYNPLSISGTTFILEYTRINPFVMTHWTNVNSYTNWNLSLGSSVQPNSDEWLFGVDCDITARLFLTSRIKIQRAGENIYDSQENVIFDAGSDLLHGSGHLDHPNSFLEGARVNRSIVSLGISWQVVRQYYIEMNYFQRFIHYTANDRRMSDSILWLTMRLDY